MDGVFKMHCLNQVLFTNLLLNQREKFMSASNKELLPLHKMGTFSNILKILLSIPAKIKGGCFTAHPSFPKEGSDLLQQMIYRLPHFFPGSALLPFKELKTEKNNRYCFFLLQEEGGFHSFSMCWGCIRGTGGDTPATSA